MSGEENMGFIIRSYGAPGLGISAGDEAIYYLYALHEAGIEQDEIETRKVVQGGSYIGNLHLGAAIGMAVVLVVYADGALYGGLGG